MVMCLFYANLWSQDLRGNGQWLRFGLANDVVFQTDKYYTNGINLEYISENNFTILEPLHFLHSTEAVSFNALTLKQDIFTPEKKGTGGYNGQDRPFASYLLLGSQKTSLNYSRKLLFTSQFEVGVLGKYAGGELVQNSVHSALPTSSNVYGWENQVKSDLVINYGLELEKGLVNNTWFGLSGHAGAKLGLPYTFASTGITFRAGEYSDYFSNLGLYRSSGWQAYLFTKLDANMVLYNATVQGGLFNPMSGSNHLELNPFVFKAKSGLHLSYQKVKFEIGMQQVSPEFKNGDIHRWGYLSFTLQL
jgi:lipid A 3-O-deacylase